MPLIFSEKSLCGAGRQFGRPAFRRASIGWLGGLQPAGYYLSLAAEEAAQSEDDTPRQQQWSSRSGRGRVREQTQQPEGGGVSGSFQVEPEQTSVEHGLPSVVDVRRWSGSGQCVEAALREEVLEVSRTLIQWVATVSKSRRANGRTQNNGARGGADAGGEIPA